MRGVGMAQPMGRHRDLDPGPGGRGPDDAVHLDGAQVAFPLAAGEHRTIRGGLPPERHELLPGGGGQEHEPGFAALAIDCDLAGAVPLLEVPPLQPADFADPEPAGVKEPEQDPVAGVGLQGQEPVDLGLRQDSFRQGVLDLGGGDGGGRVEGEIADPLSKGEKGLGRVDGPGLGSGGQVRQAVRGPPGRAQGQSPSLGYPKFGIRKGFKQPFLTIQGEARVGLGSGGFRRKRAFNWPWTLKFDHSSAYLYL